MWGGGTRWPGISLGPHWGYTTAHSPICLLFASHLPPICLCGQVMNALGLRFLICKVGQDTCGREMRIQVSCRAGEALSHGPPSGG